MNDLDVKKMFTNVRNVYAFLINKLVANVYSHFLHFDLVDFQRNLKITREYASSEWYFHVIRMSVLHVR